MPDLSVFRAALADLEKNRERSPALAEALGMTAIPNPVNRAASPGELQQLLSGRVGEFYRVGEVPLGPATAGLYLAYADEWHQRSADREPYRRKVARALVEHGQQDGRWICLLLDGNGQSHEAEIILPRRREGAAPGTVRATIDLRDPTHFHLERIAGLSAAGAGSLAVLSRKWNDEFSVEVVTKKFHEDFRALRDRFVAEVLKANPANAAFHGRDPKRDLALLAFGTRQLGRVLFLWFLQQKRWLGGAPGNGFLTFLQDEYRKHATSGVAGHFFNDVLLPLFFDGLGQSESTKAHRDVAARFGPVPFLGGGLFRPDQFEEQVFGVDAAGSRTTHVLVPDGMFDPAEGHASILGFLTGYRFTTQESTPDDQSVDPDPELLGKVFENLYQEDDRHQTGAYYTPREIVHYMCRQSLDGYLVEQTGVSQDTLDWLREEAIDWTVSDQVLDARMAEALHHALDNVTILDPAVGSGAFLIGAMQEIVLLRRGLEQSQVTSDLDPGSLDIAEWKRRAITQSLHGVDINPMAVEICKLRLWLSLVIDLDIADGQKPINLPDLDFRILAGDSLVDRMGKDPFIQSLPDPRYSGWQPRLELSQQVNKFQNELDSLRKRFDGEGVTPSEKRDLSRRIHRAGLDIARVQLEEALDRANESYSTLQENPKTTKKALKEAADHLNGLERLEAGLGEEAPFQKPFLWPVNFHEILSKGGFDVVLANPPYVRQEHLDAIDQESYGFAFKEVHAGTADLLVYFYSRALQLLRDGGHVAFITSNKYMRAAYGSGLRATLPKSLQMKQVIDFGDLPLFTVAAYPAVVIGQKRAAPASDAAVGVADLVDPIRKRLAEAELAVNHINVREALESLPAILEGATVPDYPQSLLRESGWILEDPALVRLFDRLMAQGTPLGEYVEGRMFNGIKSGLNEAFVLDDDGLRDLLEVDPASRSIIRPWLRGQDVKRWKAVSHRHLICISRGTEIDRYPAVLDHLSKFKDGLLRRDNAGKDYPWWELSRPRGELHAGYQRSKVIFNRFANGPAFAYDKIGLFHTDSCYSCASPHAALAGVLNSKVCWWLLSHLCTPLQNGYLQLFLQFLERLPIPRMEESTIRELDALVELVIREPTETNELRIETIVRREFGLTAVESSLIDRWFNRSTSGSGDGQSVAEDD
ncbi:MAG: DNA methyltransferase [Dehalococcoidia bacterium]